jgi:hypothetical protein
MDDSFVILQSERSQFRAHGPVIRVKNVSNLVGVKGQVMPILHLGQIQLEVRRRPFAGMMIPPVIQKQRRDRDRSFHLASVNAVCHL